MPASARSADAEPADETSRSAVEVAELAGSITGLESSMLAAWTWYVCLCRI
jgi:hypothetical protein